MSTKYTGKNLVVEWCPAIGGTVALDATSRTFEVAEDASEIDLSTREDAAVNSTYEVPGPAKRKVTMSGLDNSGGTAPSWDMEEVQIGQSGTVFYYPEGKTSGKRKRSIAGTVQTRKFSSPFDNGCQWDIGWTCQGPVTRSTVP